jgi:Rrf2 family protein
MLTMTRKTEYALIAVCHLAREAGKEVSARDIAEAHGVPLPLLMNVLKRLNRTGHVTSVRGARGGYMLAVPAETFSLDALIEAVEGPVHLVRCTNTDKNGRRCTLTGICPIRPSVHRVHNQLRKFLTSVTVADLAAEERPAATPAVAVSALAQ